MGPLRVAFVAPSLDILGGQAVQADRLLRAWKNDSDVHAFLVPVNPPPPRPLRFTTRVKYLRTVVNQLTYGPLLVREIARADVVHVFSASYTSFLLAPLPALAVARMLGRPVVLNYRSGQAPDHLRRSAIARTAIASADVNVVPSPFLAGVFGGHGIPTTIIPNIVDPERFKYRERRTLAPRLVSTRNFEPLYNVETTLRAFRIVQDRWPNATLTLVGGGPSEAALKSLTGQLALRGVTFAGRARPDDIARVYADHDIYIQSPDIDNMPTSVLEAFASGLPVVSTRAGGVPAILTDGRHGLLAPVGDHEALARHVLRLLADSAYAFSLSRAAFESCQAYTWTAVRQRWLDAYRAAIAASASETSRLWAGAS